MPDVMLFVLLIVAVLIGYVLGRFAHKKKPEEYKSSVSKEYFVGLNYLLNEQPDEAFDAFISALDMNTDTVDTYLALGSLFCKRGEVDRSIRVHQDLLARPSLTNSQSIKVQLELAKDYMSAGLLDRAEAMLVDLVKYNHDLRNSALQQLLKIYEQEKEWVKAIVIAESLRRNQSFPYFKILAFYYCEQAESHLNSNDLVPARLAIKNAFSRDKNCVRASLLLGRMEHELGRYRSAASALERIVKQDVRYIPLSISLLECCYDGIPNNKVFSVYLRRCMNKKPGNAVILAMTKLIGKNEGERSAIEFLSEQLYKRPTLSGLSKLIELQQLLGRPGKDESFRLFQELIRNMLALKPVFSCSSCGFNGKEMHWLCPSCNQWGVVSPIEGIEGE